MTYGIEGHVQRCYEDAFDQIQNVGCLPGQMTWYLRKRNKTKTVVTVKKKSPKSKIMSKVETNKEGTCLSS